MSGRGRRGGRRSPAHSSVCPSSHDRTPPSCSPSRSSRTPRGRCGARAELRAAFADRRVPGVARRRLVTAALGLCGVIVALAYNRYLTGSSFVFPYQAFAPHDGLGFGQHALRGYGHDYTPAVALRANAVVVWRLILRWVAGGLLGSALAAVGLAVVLSRRRDADARLLVLASLYPSVVLGNVYFWGNYNLLSPEFNATQGLLRYLGPYYHFALLAPTAVFAALGIRWLHEHARPRLADVDRHVALTVSLVACVVAAAAVGGALAGPLARNAANTAEYEQGYAPLTDGAAPANAVVFLPPTYGDWLNHPYQILRNDPRYDAATLYALDGVRSLAVTAAYPNRTYYRYAFRGTWVPTDDLSVHSRTRTRARDAGNDGDGALDGAHPPGCGLRVGPRRHRRQPRLLRAERHARDPHRDVRGERQRCAHRRRRAREFKHGARFP